MDLQRTAIQKVTLKSGGIVYIEQGRRQNFLSGGLLLAGLEVDLTGNRTGAQRIILDSEIEKRIAIGRAADGSLHEDPDHFIWGEDG